MEIPRHAEFCCCGQESYLQRRLRFRSTCTPEFYYTDGTGCKYLPSQRRGNWRQAGVRPVESQVRGREPSRMGPFQGSPLHAPCIIIRPSSPVLALCSHSSGRAPFPHHNRALSFFSSWRRYNMYNTHPELGGGHPLLPSVEEHESRTRGARGDRWHSGRHSVM